MTYSVFHRTWWTPNREWPDGREPKLGHKTYLARHIKTAEQARGICEAWNRKHDPGPLSDRAEFETERPDIRRSNARI